VLRFLIPFVFSLAIGFSAYGAKPGDVVVGKFFCKEVAPLVEIVKADKLGKDVGAMAQQYIEIGICAVLPPMPSTLKEAVTEVTPDLSVWSSQEHPLFIITESPNRI